MNVIALLPGIIWSAALGLAIGNFACSGIYRLPRGERIVSSPPFCGKCRIKLATKDLFPLFSYLFLRGQCRYCGEPIPMAYTCVELACAGLLVFSYLQYGFSESMVFLSLAGTLLIMLPAMEFLNGGIFRPVLLASGIALLFFRLLSDGTAYSALYAGLVMFLLAAAIRKGMKKPDSASWNGEILFAVMGVGLAGYDAIGNAAFIALVLWAGLLLLQRLLKRTMPLHTLPVVTGILLLLLFPALA